ncbi:MAG: hypothetical protein ACO36E_07325 [Synechocystis sp.]
MNKSDQSSRPWWIQHLDKGLLAAGALYFLLVSAWLVFQSRQPREADLAVTEPVDVVTQEDQEFIAYLQQSLQTLKQPPVTPLPAAPGPSETVEATVAIANAPAVVPPQPPSPPPVATAPPVEAPPTTTVVERYYYPVYPNNLAAPVAPQAVAPPVQTPPAAPMVASATKHDLVGILESGDRSSALFRWNNMTQKIQLGEAIGSSGWQLTSVVGQKAILSRQGKTRYLEVGQSF